MPAAWQVAIRDGLVVFSFVFVFWTTDTIILRSVLISFYKPWRHLNVALLGERSQPEGFEAKLTLNLLRKKALWSRQEAWAELELLQPQSLPAEVFLKGETHLGVCTVPVK